MFYFYDIHVCTYVRTHARTHAQVVHIDVHDNTADARGGRETLLKASFVVVLKQMARYTKSRFTPAIN